MSKRAPQPQCFLSVLASCFRSAQTPCNSGKPLEQLRRPRAVVGHLLERRERVFVMRCSVIPCSQTHGLVAGKPRIFVGSFMVAAQSKMVRKLVESGGRALRPALECGGNTAMQQSPASRDDALVHCFLHQRMRECVTIRTLRALFAKKLVCNELLENFDQLELRHAENCEEILELYGPTDNGRCRKRFERARAKRVDASQNRFTHCRRKTDPLECSGSLRIRLRYSALRKNRQQLLDEERISFCSLPDSSSECGIGLTLEHASQHLRSFVAIEWLKPHLFTDSVTGHRSEELSQRVSSVQVI